MDRATEYAQQAVDKPLGGDLEGLTRLDGLADDKLDMAEMATLDDAGRILREEVEVLPYPGRLVLQLRYYKSFTFGKMAEVCGFEDLTKLFRSTTEHCISSAIAMLTSILICFT